MSKPTLPEWAESAIDTLNAEELRPQLIRRWREIELDVLPCLAELHDIEKQQVLDCALWAGKFWQEEATNLHRDKLKAARELRGKIIAAANSIASKIRNLRELAEKNDVYENIPGFFEIVEAAKHYDSNWLRTLQSRGDASFIYESDWEQMRPSRNDLDHGESSADKVKHFIHSFDMFSCFYGGGHPPSMEAMLSAFADCLEKDENPQSIIANRLSRKRDADPLRVLLFQLRERLPYPLRMSGFKLSDQAIATLAAVLFDLDPPPTSDAVKMLRTRMQAES